MDCAKLCAAICVVVIGGAILTILVVVALDAWTTVSSAKRRPDSSEPTVRDVPEDPRERVPRAWRSPSIKSIYGDKPDK